MDDENEMEEFDEMREDTSENASEQMLGARENNENMSKKYVCEMCGEEFTTPQAFAGHMKGHRKEKEWEGIKNIHEQPNEQTIKPPEIEILDEAIKFIEERLKQVYGISDNLSRIIIKSLKDNPTPLRDANLLFNFIKSMAPRAYDMHIATFVVSPLYANFPNLPEAVDGYLSINKVPHTMQPFSYMQMPPIYMPHINQFGIPMIPQQQIHHYGYYPFFQRFYPFFQYYPIQQLDKESKQEKLYKIVVDGQEIETDEAGFLAWQRYLREREEYERKKQEHELRMRKLELEIMKLAGESSKEEKIPVKIGDKEYMLPASVALPYILKADDKTNEKIEKLSNELKEEREARHRAEIEMLKRELEELKRRPSFFEELAAYEAVAERLGLSRSGKTTLDVLDSLIGKIDQRAAQLLEKIPAPMSREWKPEIKRSPSERRQVAEKILEKLGKTEEIIQVENELIEAATKLKSRVSEK